MNTTPILRATNIVKKLGGKTILNDVSLDVHKGDVKVVIGPSGAGKARSSSASTTSCPRTPATFGLRGRRSTPATQGNCAPCGSRSA